jgi:hypothetical protein
MLDSRALVGPVAGLLTVVADLRPGLVAPLGRTVGGSVTESTIKGTSKYHTSATALNMTDHTKSFLIQPTHPQL